MTSKKYLSHLKTFGLVHTFLLLFCYFLIICDYVLILMKHNNIDEYVSSKVIILDTDKYNRSFSKTLTDISQSLHMKGKLWMYFNDLFKLFRCDSISPQWHLFLEGGLMTLIWDSVTLLPPINLFAIA